MKSDFYQQIIRKAPFGYAYHEIILDETGKPFDYRFIEVNEAFEKLTGLKKENLIGRTVSQAIPGIEKGTFDWIGYYGKIALEEGNESFEQYSDHLKKWYKVHAYSTKKSYFTTIFIDTTTDHIITESSRVFNSYSAKNIDYGIILKQMLDITGAKYAALNIFDEDKDFTTTAIAGVGISIKKAISILGYEIEGKKWKYDPDREEKISASKTTIFSSLKQLCGNSIPHNIVSILEKTFNLGQIVVIKSLKETEPVGDFTLIFEKGTELRNQEPAEVYADLTGMLVSRIRAEEAVVEKKHQYESLVSNIPGITYRCKNDTVRTMLFLSANVYAVSGYSAGELLHNDKASYAQLIHNEDINKTSKAVSSGVENKKAWAVEYRIRCKDGTIRWVCEKGCGIYNQQGEVLYLDGFIMDITERKMTEVELTKAKSQTDKFFNQSLHGFFFCMFDEPVEWYDSTDKEAVLEYALDHQRMTRVNQAMLDQYGAVESDFIGITVRELFRHDPDHAREIWRGLFDRGNWHVETREQKMDGTPIVIDGDYICLYDEQGRITGHFGVQIEITERKQAEKALKISEEKFHALSTLLRLLADNMPDMLWAKNLDKEYIFANRAICEKLLNAADTKEPLGKNDMFFASRERASNPENPEWHTFGEICRDSDAITLEEMKPMQFDEFGNVKSKFLFLDVHKAPLINDEGQLIGVVGSARDVTAAKEAENQLRKLSRAVEQSPASVVVTDLSGTIEYVNPKFTEVTGYTFEEAKGQNPRILKSGEMPDEVYKELWEAISAGKEWKGELHNKKKSGELFWESAIISPIRNEKGEITHYLGVKEDVTESMLQAENIRIAKDTYQSIFNSVTEAIYVQDEDEIFVDVNQGAIEMYGYTREELIGKSPADVSAPGLNDFQAIKDFIQNVSETGTSQSLEFWGIRKNGEVFPKEVIINKGRYLGKDSIIVTARDITERKKAEEKVKENERFLESIFESIQDGLSILDTELNVRHANRVMKEWYAPNLPLEGKKCFRVYHNRDKACEACPTIACMKSGKTESAIFPGLPGAINEWVEVFGYPVKDASTGKITGVVKFVRDVTKRINSENIAKASRELAILQRSAIAQLVTEDSFVNGDIPEALKIITKMLSQLIEVERASVWHLSEDNSELICLDLYEASKQAHSNGDVLKTKIFPSYFEAIESESRIYADDAQNDPCSGELTESYLKPLNISSLLDAGITIGGSLIGVVSCEHIGDSRKWRPDEESFISTIAAIVSQLFENNRRRQAEQKLKESEETYRNIFQNAQVGLFRTRISDGKMIESNEQLAKMCGYDSREEFINEYFTSHNYVDAGVRENMLAELNENGAVQNFEARFYRKDRSIFWVSFSARIFPEKGWLEGVVEDVTLRKLAEERIRESESKYRLLIETMNDGVMQVDSNDRIIFTNQRICDLFGYDTHELLGQISYKTLIFQDDWKIILDKNINRTKKITEHYEVRGVKKSGKVFWIHVSAAPMVDQQGSVVGSVGILRDISGRKKAEEALRENEQRFRMVLENMPILLNAFDHAGNFIAWNKACEEVTGYKASEVIGNPDAMRWMYPDQEYRELVWNRSEDPHNTHKEFNLLTKNGETRIISWFDTFHYVDIPGWASWGIGIDITERRRAEENLLKTKQLLEQTSKMSKVGGWEKNLLSGEDNWSEVTKEIHEVEPDFVPDMKNSIEFYKEGESRNRITEVVKKLIERGEPYDVELQLITAKGNKRWIRTIGMGDFRDGVCHRIYGTFQDITNQKNVEQALKDAAENWNRTFRSMRDGVALLNADQKFIQCNKAFQEFVKQDHHNLQGKDCFNFVHGSDSPIDNCPFKRMQISKKRESMEMLINGRVCEVLVDPILDQNNNITGAVHVLSDITLRKRTENLQQVLYQTAKATITSETIEELLAVVRNELGKVLDTTNFIVALYDPDEEMLRKVIFIDEKDDFTAWKTENTLSGMVVKLGESILLTREEEAEFAKKHGLELQGTPAECWLGVPMILGNEVAGVMVIQSYKNTEAYDNNSAAILEMIAHEISIFIERRNMIDDLIFAKNQAEAGNRLKTEFMNNISHEIRTPLNGILGSAQLMAYPDLAEQERNANIKNMRESTDRLINTVADYMDASLLASNNMKVNISDTPVNTLFYELYLDFQDLFEAKNIGFNLEIPNQNKDVIILTDKQLLRKAMKHLLNNALKFTNKGVISFGYSLQESNLGFYVKDTGIGIENDALEKIFEAFVHEESGITRKYEGSGLGLTIANGIINLLGGKISVDSEKRKGSVFYFSLPNMPSKVEIESEVSESKLVEILGKPLILIAEDEDSNYNYVNTVLVKAGFRTIRASNGNEAIHACTQNPEINLVLMDLKMPEMDGLEATKIIKELTPAMPVIATTAYALTGDRELALEAGCNDYLAKPFEKTDLLYLINQYIHQKPH